MEQTKHCQSGYAPQTNLFMQRGYRDLVMLLSIHNQHYHVPPEGKLSHADPCKSAWVLYNQKSTVGLLLFTIKLVT